MAELNGHNRWGGRDPGQRLWQWSRAMTCASQENRSSWVVWQLLGVRRKREEEENATVLHKRDIGAWEPRLGPSHSFPSPIVDGGLWAPSRPKFQILTLKKRETASPQKNGSLHALEMTQPLQNQTKLWKSQPGWYAPYWPVSGPQRSYFFCLWKNLFHWPLKRIDVRLSF